MHVKPILHGMSLSILVACRGIGTPPVYSILFKVGSFMASLVIFAVNQKCFCDLPFNEVCQRLISWSYALHLTDGLEAEP